MFSVMSPLIFLVMLGSLLITQEFSTRSLILPTTSTFFRSVLVHSDGRLKYYQLNVSHEKHYVVHMKFRRGRFLELSDGVHSSTDEICDIFDYNLF